MDNLIKVNILCSTSKGGATIVEFIDGTSVEVEQDIETFLKRYEDKGIH